MTLAPSGTRLYKTTYGNSAPRLGVAYQFRGIQNWEAVLRGGFGIFYDLASGGLGGVSSYFPYTDQKNFSDVPFPLNPQNAAPPVITTSPPTGTFLVAVPNFKLPRHISLKSRDRLNSRIQGSGTEELLWLRKF
jgi:hypothetical protein